MRRILSDAESEPVRRVIGRLEYLPSNFMMLLDVLWDIGKAAIDLILTWTRHKELSYIELNAFFCWETTPESNQRISFAGGKMIDNPLRKSRAALFGGLIVRAWTRD